MRRRRRGQHRRRRGHLERGGIGVHGPVTERPAPVALGLGSNLGDRRAVLALGVRLLAPYLDHPRVAPLFETEPVSEVPQGLFLNTALVAETGLSPADLLGVAKAAELAAGRRIGERWGPRPLDIDLLLYSQLVRSDPELTLPHPLLRRRLFYLAPLAEIAPDLAVPPDGARVADLRDRLGSGNRLRRIDWSPLG